MLLCHRTGEPLSTFPRWPEDVPISVAELGQSGDRQPYPNVEWNSWRNARRDEVSPGGHWVCLQSVVADKRGNLWVIDPGAPAQSLIVPGAPKLVQIDLASGEVRRVLDGDPSTQVDKSVTVTVDGKPLQQTDGRRVSFSADGIALTPDGRYLCGQTVKGKTKARRFIASSRTRCKTRNLAHNRCQPEWRLSEVTEPADGLWIDERGRLYVSSVEHHAVRVRDGSRLSTVVRDRQLVWPDTFTEGPDGTLYVTDSRISDMRWFNSQSPTMLPTQLYAIKPFRSGLWKA